MITLDVDMPDTEMSKAASIDIEGRKYTGVVKVIIIHEAEPEAPAPTTVTLEAPGLTVKTA
jgi:hypothetical protein